MTNHSDVLNKGSKVMPDERAVTLLMEFCHKFSWCTGKYIDPVQVSVRQYLIAQGREPHPWDHACQGATK